MSKQADAALKRVRACCAALPDVTERASHGAPSWYVREKHAFAHFLDNHHGDGKLALWCMAPEGAQAMLVESNPEVYFVPAYVGHLGWIGVRLDRKAPWPEIEAVLAQAHAARVAKLTAGRRRTRSARS